MQEAFEKAQWIWVEGLCGANSYGEFYDEFVWQGGKCVCRLSADSDYTLYINGKFVAANQYGDFEWYKSYDDIDISPYLVKGKNKIAVLVWHFGTNTQRYLASAAGLIFEVKEAGQVCVESSEKTLSRASRAYKNGYEKQITVQLGYSYLYDANKQDNWINGELDGFKNSVCVDKNCSFVARPVKKAVQLALKKAKLLESVDNKVFVLDLGEETVGLLSFALRSKTAQKITVSYGEDLENGRVRRIVGARDFSVEYIAKTGENAYENDMLRFGCRYLQFDCEEEIDLLFAGLIPQVYPTKPKAFKGASKLDNDIYDLCLRSLQLCMMEHYVDCPWREQCLYAFDSRNQMLCGYYAFEDKNAEYVRANLLLMSKDRRMDDLLAICFPCGEDLTIPSFALYYTLSVKEYTEYTGDITLAKEVFAKMCKVVDVFLGRKKNGLIHRFAEKQHWNFYDWSEYAEGQLHQADEPIPDAVINILTVMALQCLERICALADLPFPYAGEAEEIAKATYETFFDKEAGAMTATAGTEQYTELVNALAVVFGVVSGKDAEGICEKLVKGELIPCSLSMKVFKYDALIKTNKEKYRDIIWSEIYRDYQIMLDGGATATWETIEGAIAFEHAGSLCHGWTAIPIYYYNVLK